jgi:signal transduction histidine kinase
MAMGLWASGGALLLAAASFMTYNVMTYRASMVESLTTLGEIVSLNASSAIVFNDSVSATTTLAALKARSSIVAACIYTPEGKPFAIWQRNPNAPIEFPALPSVTGNKYEFHNGSLHLFHLIFLDKAFIGEVYIESDLSELAVQRKRYAIIAAAVLFISLLVAGSIASQVGQRISSPILHLADIAQAVSEKKDYSVHAQGGGPDEVGRLIRAFNDMLSKIQQDGTDLQRAHDELEQRVEERTAQLSAANKELEAFSYSVSHDLRAPVRHINGFAELLLKNTNVQMDTGAIRYLKLLTDSAKKMGALIDDLLSFSRMGRTELLNTTLHLRDIVQDVLGELKPQIQDRDVEWNIHALPIVHGDPAMIRIVFMNLISNALKYSRLKKKAMIEIGAFEGPREEKVIFIRDNGAGFDMKYAGKLFGVFQRLHSSDEFEGTGIGLATVRRIIQRHGGRTWAEGIVDEGAAFYFTFQK